MSVIAPTASRPHPVLATLFDAFERQGLGWMLMRVPSDLSAPTGDVDLLVLREHAAALRHVAEAHGFVALPGWDRPPDLILIRYDEASDVWLVLDVTTEVAFGRHRLELAGLAPGLLGRRQARGPVREPQPEDAFWLLALHCILDRGTVAPHYRPRLAALASGAPSPVAAALAEQAAVPPALLDALRAAAEREDWERFAGSGAALERCWRRARPVAQRARAGAARARRVLRKPSLVRRRRGVSIALLGPNGAGKSTLARELNRRLPFPGEVVYMGLWKDDPARARPSVRDALRRPVRVWRLWLHAQRQLARGRTVIFDRYVYEARLPAQPPLVALKRPYLWALAHACPSPDLTIVLDAAGDVVYRRKQENLPGELDLERAAYSEMALRIPGAHVVDASRPPHAVRAEVTALLWARIARRWQAR